MRMNNIHNYGNAERVCFVYKRFQFFRCAESAGGSEETGNVVAERAIVWVLLDSHNLDCIVSVFSYARKDKVAEFRVSTHAFTLQCHTYMTFINKERFCFRNKIFIFPAEFLFRVPHLCGEEVSVFVLHHTSGVSRDAFTLTAVPFDKHFVKIAVVESFCREFEFPHTAVKTF